MDQNQEELMESNPQSQDLEEEVEAQEMEEPQQVGEVEEEEEELKQEEGGGDDPIHDPATAAADVDSAAVEAEAEQPVMAAVEKRKRGRPRKTVQSAVVKQPAAKKKDEEDVCFVCFDGGSLVCCDRRGCPKVYHAACINREEDFFKAKVKWNCGWHICSICEKAAHYMCYTCTYSLCKGCIKEAAFMCVRGNKGFCETCYGTVMLIESNEHANEKKVDSSSEDKNNFECLFKTYWIYLKEKFTLTVEEIKNAKRQVKLSSANTRIEDSSSDELYVANDEQEASSDSSLGHHEATTSSRKKVRRRSRATVAQDRAVLQQVGNEGGAVTQVVVTEGTFISEGTDWASKELLEFVAHMKGGDKSVLSQFDVQALLLEYIKQNNLRDPRRKSQIICDRRLENLFGKARVGHFEMLKLLESHFLIKEVPQVLADDQGANVDPDFSQVDADASGDGATKGVSDKRRKGRKKIEEREPQSNLDDYAAIDVHNISLIYLRRNLIEDLFDDAYTFSEKVVGSFVRIRISGSAKQEIYRLVQVVGTSKAADSYKTGRKTSDFTLEILNLDKKEIITIDTVSNQEFTEEECKRLRQSIKLGLLNRLTVGDIQEKARVLQAVKVNDWLETEKQRLGHLRDRASEKGRRKELRECVEKLQLLSTPEERIRRLNEVTEIHSDPKMDPDYESADEEEEPDTKSQDTYSRPRGSSFKKGRDAVSPGTGSARKGSNPTWDSNRNTRTEATLDKLDTTNNVTNRTNEPAWIQEQDGLPSYTKESGTKSKIDAINPEQNRTTASPTSDTSETEKVWHYRDPAGKIQGPFSIIQLRKWNTTGYFPNGMRIWQASEHEDSVLLSDALSGKFEKDLPPWEPPQNNHSQPTKSAGDEQNNNSNLSSINNNLNCGIWTGTASRIEAANPSPWSSNQPQFQSTPRPMPPSYGNPHGPPNYEGSVVQGVGNAAIYNPGQDHRSNWSLNNPRPPQSVGQGYDLQNSRNQWGNDSYNLSTPVPRPSGRAWPAAQGTMNIAAAPTPGLHTPGAGWGAMNIPPSPTPSVHPTGTGWGTMNVPLTPTPLQPMGTGWGTLPASGINVGNSVGSNMAGWGSGTASLTNPATKVAVNNAAHFPPIDSPTPESSRVLNKNPFFESDCPSPTPSTERQGLPSVQKGEIAVERLDPSFVAPTPSGGPRFGSSSSAEKSGPLDNMSPIRDTEVKPTHPALTNKPSDGVNVVESLGSLVEGSQVTMRDDAWSLPSPTPSTKPPIWNAGSVSPSGTNRNNPHSSLDGTTEQSRPPQPSWGVNDNSISRPRWGVVAPQTENLTAPGNVNPTQIYPVWGTAMQQNAGWEGGQGDANGWGTHQSQGGDRYRGNYDEDSRHGSYPRRGGDYRHDSRYGGDSRHGGGWDPRNDRARQRNEGQGQGQGICKFHESGFCKKGARCNYRHS